VYYLLARNSVRAEGEATAAAAAGSATTEATAS
jgi:hypothetical protein